MCSCILLTQIINDLMQQLRKVGVRVHSGDVKDLCMHQLTATFWPFESCVNTYFVTNASAEVRDTSARWVGSRGGGVGALRSDSFISKTPLCRSSCDSYAKTRFPSDLASCLSEICGHSSANLICSGMRVTQIMVDL